MKYLMLGLFYLCLCHSALSQNEWELKKDEEGIKVYIAETPNSKFKSFRGEATIDANFEEVYNYLIELDHFGKYYDLFIQTTDEKRISASEIQYNVEFDFPWPLQKRWSKTSLKHYPIETGAYEIFIESIASNEEKEGFVKIKYFFTVFAIINAGNNTTSVRMTGFMDPSGSIPARIANFKIVDSPFSTLVKLKALLEK